MEYIEKHKNLVFREDKSVEDWNEMLVELYLVIMTQK